MASIPLFVFSFFSLPLQKQKEVLDVSTSALVSLLNAQPNLADAIPVLGHIPKFFRQLSIQPKSALTVLHQLSLSDVSTIFLFIFFLIFSKGIGATKDLFSANELNVELIS